MVVKLVPACFAAIRQEDSGCQPDVAAFSREIAFFWSRVVLSVWLPAAAADHRPNNVLALQAAAAIGQGHLMALYDQALARHERLPGCSHPLGSGRPPPLSERIQHLKQPLDWRVLPVINENDALSTAELRFGDNDTLSALVAAAVGADQLILMTDVDQLYSADPRTDSEARPIPDVHHPRELRALEAAAGGGGRWGTGGMTTKLAAARIATASGITVHLADACGARLEICSKVAVEGRLSPQP